jgi:CHAD domain-containing protein
MQTDQTFGALALSVVSAQRDEMLTQEPAVRADQDPEALHDMRVATRRLRAALRFFEGAFGPDAEPLREEIGWLGRGLGSARDQDVQLARLRDALGDDEQDEPDQRAIEAILAAASQRRDAAHREMVAMLDGTQFEQLRATLDAFIAAGATGARAVETATAVLPELIEARFRKLKKLGKRLTEDSAPEDFHELRIRGKRLRYAVEFASDLYGEPAANYANRLVALQDLLGEHQDAYVAMEQLRGLVEDHGSELSRKEAFVLGGLAERERVAATDLRRHFPTIYRKAKGKAWRALRDEMETQAPEPG